MPLDFEKLSPQELLAAESAVLTMRSLLDAVRTAPHGHGMACVESVLYDKGFDHLRSMLAAAAASHEGAQKKGLQFGLPLRQEGVIHPVRPQADRERGRARGRAPAVLRLPALRGQADAVGGLGRAGRGRTG